MNVKHNFKLPKDVMDVLENCMNAIIPKTREELIALTLGGKNNPSFEVSYEAQGKKVVEANITRCKNGASINYVEDYMRRRDPDCLVVADDKPTDKPRFWEQSTSPRARRFPL